MPAGPKILMHPSFCCVKKTQLGRLGNRQRSAGLPLPGYREERTRREEAAVRRRACSQPVTRDIWLGHKLAELQNLPNLGFQLVSKIPGSCAFYMG